MNDNVQAIYKETVQRLSAIYEATEASSIASLLFSDLFDIDKITRLTNQNLYFSPDQKALWVKSLARLENMEPIQQIIGRTYFYGHPFLVNRHTLIPRPETEELVDLIIQENKKSNLIVLDIGTGSGCIPISLALHLENANVHSIDISPEALTLATENAKVNRAKVVFSKLDILKDEITYSNLDIVVSNPPYIPQSEEKFMDKNVTEFEPGLALFVPDNDPLIFYRVIAEKAINSLSSNGKLYFEIHHAFGKETADLVRNSGFENVRLLQDFQGKDRFVCGVKP
jgi:release factor glutamine methyltransferase